MLFWIFCIVLAIGIVWLVKANYWDDGYDCAVGITVAGGIAVGISLIVMAIFYIAANGFTAANNARYEALTYQYENDVYENDNDLGKRELIKDIQDWNEDLARGQALQDDFWIGIYIPNIYDQFEPIKLAGGAEK